jgi:hypothetical protein
MVSMALASEEIVHKITTPRSEISGAGKGVVVVFMVLLLDPTVSSPVWE